MVLILLENGVVKNPLVKVRKLHLTDRYVKARVCSHFNFFYLFVHLLLIMSMSKSAAIQCPRLEPPDNGMISYEPDMIPNFDLDTIANYTCFENYVLVGNSTRTCIEGEDGSTIGEWTGSAPSCRG